LAEFRADFARAMGVASMAEAFVRISKEGGFNTLFSPETVITSWLFYNKREEYSWHIRDARDGHHYVIHGLDVTVGEAAITAQYNIPMASKMKQLFGNDKKHDHYRFNWEVMGCVGSAWEAPGCELFHAPTRRVMRKWMSYSLSVDYYCPPYGGGLCFHAEHVWSTENEGLPGNWDVVYRRHEEEIEATIASAALRGLVAFGMQRGAAHYGLTGIHWGVTDADTFNNVWAAPEYSVVQAEGQSALYLVYNDSRHVFNDWGTFVNCGYDTDDVVKYKDAYNIFVYEEGTPVPNPCAPVLHRKNNPNFIKK